jgi:hypothetical protein
MSTCISSHGEFGWHECSVDFVCDYCGEFDREAAFAALNEANVKIARLRELATEWAKAHEPFKPSDWNYGFDEGGRTAGEWVLEVLDGNA